MKKSGNATKTMNAVGIGCLAQVALLIALEIILSRFLSIATPIVKISFSFLPLAIIAILYGPVYAGVGAAIADFLGAILFPIGPYFPGFTLSACLTGIVYGLFLHKKPLSYTKLILAVIIINLFIQLGLDSLWLMIMGIGDKGFWGLVSVRAMKCFIMIPIQVIGIKSLNGFLREVRNLLPTHKSMI